MRMTKLYFVGLAVMGLLLACPSEPEQGADNAHVADAHIDDAHIDDAHVDDAALSADGAVSDAGTNSDRVKWSYATGDMIQSSPAIAADGTVYVGSDDYKLYAIQGSAGLASSPWPKFSANNQNTGRP